MKTSTTAPVARTAHRHSPARPRYFKSIPLDRIKIEPQVRKIFQAEGLAELTESVRDIGIRQPPTVRPIGAGTTFALVTGERRVRAAREAKLDSVDCLIIDGNLSPADILELQLTENLQQEDLDPLEAAEGFSILMRLRGWNQIQLAEHLHISNSKVTRILALQTLDPAVKEQLIAGKLPASTGYELSKVANPEEQTQLARKIVTEKITRDAAATMIRSTIGSSKKRNTPAPTKTKPARKQLEFKTEPNSTVVVTSDQHLALSEICQALRQALTHSLKYRRTPWKSPLPLSLGMLAEIFHALDREDKTLAPTLEELVELIQLLLAEELGCLFSLKDGRSDAARRAYNRLGDETKAALGPISPKTRQK